MPYGDLSQFHSLPCMHKNRTCALLYLTLVQIPLTHSLTHSLAHSLTNQTNHIYISNPDQKPKPLCLSTPRRNMHTYTFIQAEYLALSCLLLFLFLFLFFFVFFGRNGMNFYGSPQTSVRNSGRTSGRAACPFLSRHWAVPYCINEPTATADTFKSFFASHGPLSASSKAG